MIEACQLTTALTVEAWVKSGNVAQSGPARLATMSVNTGNRNFTLGQQFDAWSFRVRTPVTGVNGTSPDFVSQAGLVDLQNMQHVVFTRDAGGNEVLYLDGQQTGTAAIAGDFSNWDPNYRFAVGNELSGDRPWQGELYRVVIHSSALTCDGLKAAAWRQTPMCKSLQPGPPRRSFKRPKHRMN